MAKVLLLSLVFSPDGVSTSVLMSELAQELQQAGHELVVMTTTPHYNVEPEAVARQPLRPKWGKLLYQSDYHGIPVYHASIPVKGSRVGARLLDYLRFHAISTVAALRLARQCEVILVPSPPLTIGLSAWMIRLIRRIPFIYNVQEIYPDVAVHLGVLQNPNLIRFFELLEKFIYRQSHTITVISERFRERLLAKGVDPKKLVVIPNFVDTEFVAPGSRQNSFSQQHSLDDKFVVLYAGNIGLTQNFETILAAAQQLTDLPDVRFLVVGDGTRREWLAEQLAKGVYPNVMLLPYQPRSVVPQIYATSDVCLVPLKRGTGKETFPSKIYTIMAAKRPVIAATDPDSELADLVKRADCGWAILAEDVEALAQAVRAAYADQMERQEKAEQGYRYVLAHHSRQAVVGQYDRLIRTIVPTELAEYGEHEPATS